MLIRLLTFETLPTAAEVSERAEQLAAFACGWVDRLFPVGRHWSGDEEEPARRVMIGGAPFLMAPLEASLRAAGFRPIHAFSIRESAEQLQPDGGVRKVAVFRHAGFVEPSY